MMWGNFVRLQLGNGQRLCAALQLSFFRLYSLLQSDISMSESCDLPGMTLLV